MYKKGETTAGLVAAGKEVAAAVAADQEGERSREGHDGWVSRGKERGKRRTEREAVALLSVATCRRQ